MQFSKLGYKLFPKSLLRPSVVIGIIASLLALGISVYTINRFYNSVNQEAQAPTNKLPEVKTVTALARLEPKGEVIKLSAPVSAQASRVEQLLVQEGQKVKAGQVIAILDSRDRLQAALKEAQEAVKVAQANLAKIKAGPKRGEIAAQKAAIARLQAEGQGDVEAQVATIARLQAELRNATAEDKRYQALYQEGAISASMRDSKRLKAETTQKNLQEAQVVLNRKKSASQQQIKEATATLDEITEVRPVDVEAASSEISHAIATVKRAEANLKQAYVRSPQDGQVFEIHAHPGELVSNEGIADIGQTSQMYAVAEVYESDVSKVKVGQKVRVISDSLTAQLQGTVEKIGLQVRRQNVVNTDPSSNTDARVVEVHVRLDETSSQKAAQFTNLQVKAVIEL
ncbi:MAG: ABC exporter membrane fusion protein [Heteroscytonema crispum UTEX LB 1556]